MAANISSVDEERITQLETEFVHASGVTCSTAYHSAIEAGLTVVISKGDKIVEVSPDGNERVVKIIVGPSSSQPGARYTIQ